MLRQHSHLPDSQIHIINANLLASFLLNEEGSLNRPPIPRLTSQRQHSRAWLIFWFCPARPRTPHRLSQLIDQLPSTNYPLSPIPAPSVPATPTITINTLPDTQSWASFISTRPLRPHSSQHTVHSRKEVMKGTQVKLFHLPCTVERGIPFSPETLGSTAPADVHCGSGLSAPPMGPDSLQLTFGR